MDSSKQILLHLSLIKGVGPATVHHITTSNVPLDTLYLLSSKDMSHLLGIHETMAQKVVNGLADRSLLETELELVAKHSDIHLVALGEQEYPELLSHIHYPPPILYVRGSMLHTSKKNIACVGARKANRYARDFFEATIPDLVSAGWTIVSGGAYGADTMAHEVTINAGGITSAVLGSGLLCPYPRKNIPLFDRIVASGGSIVSSFSLKTSPVAGNFPARNRIISGLSSGCVVVQAAKKSGALITAYSALDQGRHVFAVPGAFDEALSYGCHVLIVQGASLVTSSQDILDDLDPSCKISVHRSLQKETHHVDSLVLTVSERSIYEQCTSAVSIDELVEKTGLSLGEIMSGTCSLQLQSLIKQYTSTGLWKKI